MTELLRGRQRRYFGYFRDITHKVDTPESAKSYRSVVSNTQGTVKRRYEPNKTFKPDPARRSRFADKIIHRAVKTEIPGLLPALNNSSKFDKGGAIDLRSPDFEQHFQRSLHYLWLKKEDRTELCNYFRKHLKTKDRARLRQVKQGKLTGAAAETFALEQQDYLESLIKDPKFFKQKRVSDVPSRLFRQNRKFQSSYWDPLNNKNLLDPFRRTRTKTPGLDSICHEYWGVPAAEYADLLTCVREYNQIQRRNEELTADHIELSEAKEQARRLSLFGTIDDEERRRGIKHIKQLKDYDRESESLWLQQAKLMISAGVYINKIKAGRRFPTPPREINSRRKGSPGASQAPSSIDVYEFAEKKKLPTQTEGDPLEGLRTRHFPPLPGTPKTGKNAEKPIPVEPEERTAGVHKLHSHHDRHKKRKHQHYHHDYNTEEFFMEMYLHFMNPDEDVSLKTPPTQLTDVKELRKKMNLDEDHEQDKKLIEILNADSIEALHIHKVPRKTMLPGEQHPSEEEHQRQMTSEEMHHEKEVLAHHLQRLNNPRLTHMLTKVISQMSLRSSYLTLTSSSAGTDKVTSPEDQDHDDIMPQMSSPWDKTQSGSTQKNLDVELDPMGDVPEHELTLIMSEIADSKDSISSQGLSSDSSQGEEEEEGEGEYDGGPNEELKLFKTVKKKKDSLAEFMDLTSEFRARVCKNEEGKNPEQMNPFAEAVCILYPDGSERRSKRISTKTGAEKKLKPSAAQLR